MQFLMTLRYQMGLWWKQTKARYHAYNAMLRYRKSIDIVDGIEVSGSEEFILCTRSAIGLLQHCRSFNGVKEYLHEIREFRRSGVRILNGRVRCDFHSPTWKADIFWYASCIVHEASHARLYFHNRRRLFGISFTPRWAWTGKHAERVCMELQIMSLRELGDSGGHESYLLTLMANPTYHRRVWRNW